MKYKLLATLVASTLLAGCHMDDESPAASKSVQAFDGAIRGINGYYNCDGGISGPSGKTNETGWVAITNPTFVNTPEKCSFEFVPTKKAVDMSNGKDMSKVSYKAPKGLFSAGKTATVSPITTLITKKLEETGEETYTHAAAVEVLKDLGLEELVKYENDSGITVTDFLQNTQETLKTIEKNPELKALHSKVAATTVALSDTLVKAPAGATAADIKDVAYVSAVSTLEKHPNYPISSETGKVIYVDLTEQLDAATFEKTKEVADEVRKVVKEAKAKGEQPKINETLKKKGLDKIVEAVENPETAVTPPPLTVTGATGANADDLAGTGA